MRTNSELTVEKIRGYILILWVSTFPFWIKLSTVLLIISTLLYIVHSIKESRFEFSLIFYLPLFLFFLLYLISMSYTDNFHEGLAELRKKIPFLFVPFAFWGVHKYFLSRLKYIFILSLLFYFTYCISFSAFSASQLEISFFHSFHLFVNSNWHASYLGVFILMGIVFLIVDFSKIKIWDMKSATILGLIITLMIFIFMNTARAEMVAAVVLLFILLYLCIKLFVKKIFRVIIGIIFIFGVLVLLLASYQKIKTYIQNDPRVEIWETVLPSIRNNFLLGTSPGDVKDVLFDGFNYDSQHLFPEKLNAHNQFLEILMGLGIIGAFVFIIILVVPLFKKSNTGIEYFLFLLIFIIGSFTESLLSRQAGVIFFIFFYCYTISSKSDDIYKIEERNLKNKFPSILLIVLFSVGLCALISSSAWTQFPVSRNKILEYDVSVDIKSKKDNVIGLHYQGGERNEITENYQVIMPMIGDNSFHAVHFVFNEINLRRIRLNLDYIRNYEQVTIMNIIVNVKKKTLPIEFKRLKFNAFCNPIISSNSDSLTINTETYAGGYSPAMTSNDISMLVKLKTSYYYEYLFLFYICLLSIILLVIGLVRKSFLI